MELFVDGWSMKNVKDADTAIKGRQDTFEGDKEVSHISAEKSLERDRRIQVQHTYRKSHI